MPSGAWVTVGCVVGASWVKSRRANSNQVASSQVGKFFSRVCRRSGHREHERLVISFLSALLPTYWFPCAAGHILLLCTNLCSAFSWIATHCHVWLLSTPGSVRSPLIGSTSRGADLDCKVLCTTEQGALQRRSSTYGTARHWK